MEKQNKIFFLIADCLSGCFDIEFQNCPPVADTTSNPQPADNSRIIVKHWKDSRYNKKKNKVLRVTIFHIGKEGGAFHLIKISYTIFHFAIAWQQVHV